MFLLVSSTCLKQLQVKLCYVIPVIPARGGAEVALRIYFKTFHTYRTCMRCAPAKPVRARCVRVCCTLAVQEHDLRATTLHCKAKMGLSSHLAVPSSHPALRKAHFHLISSQTLATLDAQQPFTQRS